MKISFLLLLILQISLEFLLKCDLNKLALQKFINSQYQNVLNFEGGSILTTARTDRFATGPTSSIFRNSFYNYGDTYCIKPCFMIIQLLKRQYINKIIFRLCDFWEWRFDVQVFIGFEGSETLIYQNTVVKEITTVKFSPLLTEYIRFYTLNGSSATNTLSLMKVIATYQF